MAIDKILSKLEETEEKSCQCRYFLILLDCNMPGMNGYDTCKTLRKMISEKTIPPLSIVAVTADVTELNI